MSDGFVLSPGAGKPIGHQLSLKVGEAHTPNMLAVECTFGPGFDVGAHIHAHHEEIFYVLEGELELFAFEPRVRTSEPGSWQDWESASGARIARAPVGSVMYVPSGCPHAFRNPGPGPMRMLFIASPAGHEHYQQDIADLLAAPPSDEEMLRQAVAEIRQKHHTEQLTPVIRSPEDL